ncbi:MAG: YihY family inner membrane protein [Planctomycetota bacterium]|nr:YihY family inner membrane protein [Planctomycetota bacterium]
MLLESNNRPPLWRLVWEKVREDYIPLRAAALSFQTLTSFVPMLVIVLAVLSSPAFLPQRERVLDKIVELLVPESHHGAAVEEPAEPAEPLPKPPEEAKSGEGAPANGEVRQARKEVQERFKEKIRSTVGKLTENIGKVSLFSFLILMFVAVMLFQTVEQTFNAIWKVNAGRSIFIKIAITTALVFWGPVVLLVSIWLTELFKDYPVLGLYVLPMLLTSLAFTAFYMIMPHVKVRLPAALCGGFVCAVLWELSKVGFIVYVTYAVGMSKVYGSLAIIPILFGWVYLSWIVVLAGADLSYIVQHHRTIVEQWETRQRHNQLISNAKDWAQREAALLPMLAFAAAVEIGKRFRLGTSPGGTKLSELADALESEPGVVERALQRLVSNGMVVKTAHHGALGGEDPRFLPAQDPAQCPMADLVKACRGQPPLPGDGESWRKAQEVLRRVEREGEQGLAEMTLADLVPAPPKPASAKPGDPAPQPAAEPKPAQGPAGN